MGRKLNIYSGTLYQITTRAECSMNKIYNFPRTISKQDNWLSTHKGFYYVYNVDWHMLYMWWGNQSSFLGRLLSLGTFYFRLACARLHLITFKPFMLVKCSSELMFLCCNMYTKVLPNWKAMLNLIERQSSS